MDSSERKKLLSDKDRPPVNIEVIRSLRSPTVSTEYDDELTTEDDDPDFPTERSTAKDEHSLRVGRNNAMLGLIDATALFTAQVKRTGFWIMVCLVVLAVATLFS